MSLPPKGVVPWKLRRCREAIAFYEPALRDITDEEVMDYALRRLVRDHHITRPKQLAADLREHQNDYQTWWERWREYKT